MSEMITKLHVYAINARTSKGVLQVGHSRFPCLIGKSGKSFRKKEGDGKSPVGQWKLDQLYYRADKSLRPLTAVETKQVKKAYGWCDASGHGQYNRFVKLPLKASHEELWRNDQAYNIVVSTDHNKRPRKQNGGSAIFLHVMNRGATGTEGCVALSEKHLRMVLLRCRARTLLII
jgi:L,D-peptidoglycan transpeptidase YkuD (ErfK/YbiS/YcfS/YnhG family)